MSIQRTFFILFFCLFASLAGLLATVFALFTNERKIVEAELRQTRSNGLASELRQSSDDLTKMARLYVQTGDPRYRAYFFEILAIRDGEAPRPERYDLVYWDLVGPDGVRPRPARKEEALISRMLTEGFTKEEFELLAHAQSLSNALVKLETVAMNAVEGRFDDGTGNFTVRGEPDLDLARSLLSGEEYMAQKQLIMEPINQFLLHVEERSAIAVAKLVDRRGMLIVAALSFSAFAAVLSGMTFVILRRRVNRPLALAAASVRSMADGDLGKPIKYLAEDEMGQFIEAFNDMSQRVKDMMRQLESDNQRLATELDISRKLQEMLLPTLEELAQIPNLQIVCYMKPMDEVGGDYYDVLQHEGRTKIGIGDVTGHGLESGVMTVMTQCVIRALLLHGEQNPVRFLDTLNRTLYDNVQRLGTDKNLSLALIDYADGELRLSGQHETMLLVRKDGQLEQIDTIDLGFPIGLEKDISSFIDHTSIRLHPGDGFVLYSDGITEAENSQREIYGLTRLCEQVRTHWDASAEAIKEAIIQNVSQFIGEHPVYDDITLIVVKQL